MGLSVPQAKDGIDRNGFAGHARPKKVRIDTNNQTG